MEMVTSCELFTWGLVLLTDLSCESWEFQCETNECIDARLRCDGRYDCADASDEFDCGNYSRLTYLLIYLLIMPRPYGSGIIEQ